MRQYEYKDKVQMNLPELDKDNWQWRRRVLGMRRNDNQDAVLLCCPAGEQLCADAGSGRGHDENTL